MQLQFTKPQTSYLELLNLEPRLHLKTVFSRILNQTIHLIILSIFLADSFENFNYPVSQELIVFHRFHLRTLSSRILNHTTHLNILSIFIDDSVLLLSRIVEFLAMLNQGLGFARIKYMAFVVDDRRAFILKTVSGLKFEV